MNHLRKLLVLGVNEMIAQGYISLTPAEGEINGHAMVVVGGKPSVLLWSQISFDEIRVSLWWDYDHSKHPQANDEGDFKEGFRTTQPLARKSRYSTFVGATVSGWLERKTSKHLQGSGVENLFDTYARRGSKELIKELPDPAPLGYTAEGTFFL